MNHQSKTVAIEYVVRYFDPSGGLQNEERSYDPEWACARAAMLRAAGCLRVRCTTETTDDVTRRVVVRPMDTANGLDDT
jgi:hypothetical protein